MDAPGPCPRKALVRLYVSHEDRRILVRPVVVGDAFAAAGGTIELDLISLRDRTTVESRSVGSVGLAPPPELVFSAEKAPWGCCAFRARFIDRRGIPWPTDVLHDACPGDHAWLGTTAGMSRDVPAPWTPLSVERRAGRILVRCWGREYRFDGSSILEQVSSGGEELLASAVRLVAVVDGRAVAWRGAAPAVREESADRVVLDGRLRGSTARGTLELLVRWEIEFDGVLRVDCAFHSRREVTVERIRLEVPLAASTVRYLYTYPGRWGGATNAGAFTGRRRSLPFRPYLWLGDEERGLGWFSESDDRWFSTGSSRERARAIDIERVNAARGSAAGVRVTMHLAKIPVTLRAGGEEGSAFTGVGQDSAPPAWQSADVLRYSFGLQATPVKPVDRDAWDHRTFCIGQQTPGFSPRLEVSDGLLDSLAASGVRTVVVFEHWADAEAYVRTPHADALKRIVASCRARGLKVLLYFGFLVSDIAPEWRSVGKDCLKIPKSGYPVYAYSPQPTQGAWIVCLQSSWQDLLVDGIARAVEEFGVDGVYLDGTELPFACANTEHGCGRLAPDGTIAPTWPIYATRTAMRRIYAAVRTRRRDGLVNVHNSTCMTMPTLGWATSYWDGEQFQGVGSGADVGAILPLDAFRAEFMGRQWGVAAEFLLAGKAYTFSEACAFSLLHDVPVRPNDPGADLQLMAGVWRAMDDFGRTGAEWLPYWRNGDAVRTGPAGVRASLYLRPRRGVLAVLSNLGRRTVDARLELDVRRLGAPADAAAAGLAASDGTAPRYAASDALSGEALHLERHGSWVRVAAGSLPPLGWKLIRVGRAPD